MAKLRSMMDQVRPEFGHKLVSLCEIQVDVHIGQQSHRIKRGRFGSFDKG
jgi:hypothetical protein